MGSPQIVPGNGPRRPAAQVRKAAARHRRFVGLVFGVLLPIAWIGLTPPFNPLYQPLKRTRRLIRQDTMVIHAFLDKFKKTPTSLSSIRSFARLNKMSYSTYDGYGQRLDYLRLDDKHYLLRSYGEDQEQNTVLSPADIGTIHWGELPPTPLTYEIPEIAEPGLYPAALLAGADSPERFWLARLFADPSKPARHLVVRHLSKSGLFMVAPHDQVEEFLWLPSGEQIIYTATSSLRYRDGLYLWNLRTDQVVNLLDLLKRVLPPAPAGNGERLWLSLAGIGRHGPTLLAYMHPRHDGTLDPRDFFSTARLLAITVPGEQPAQTRLAGAGEWSATATKSMLLQQFDLAAKLVGTGGLEMQQQWLQQQFGGEALPLLLAAQAWSAKSAATPMFPYSLWILPALYSQNAAALAPSEASTSARLRASGAEFSRALLNYPLAPSYLSGLALYAYEALMDGQSLPYRFAQLPEAGSPAPVPGSKPTQ